MARRKWTLIALEKEARKYRSRIAFIKGSRSAYKAAWRAKVLDKICDHMKRPVQVSKWTFELALIEAQKYGTRTKFSRGSSGAYDYAWKNGYLNLVCAHMPKSKRLTDYPKLVLEWHPTKNRGIFPEDFSYGSSKRVWWTCSRGHEWPASISNRTNEKKPTGCPYCSNQSSNNEIRLFVELSSIFLDVAHRQKIYGFEIDILLTTNKVAVEYDGKRWHNTPEKNALDKRKQKELIQNGYRFIRIREHPLSPINDHDLIIPTSSMLTKDQLNEVVSWINVTDQAVLDYLEKPNFADELRYLDYLEAFPSPVVEKSLAILFPDVSKEWHPTKNGKLTPYHFTPGSSEIVWWQCKENPHHVWDAEIAKRTDKRNPRGCRFCSGQAAAIDNCLATNFPDVAALWHPILNGDMTPYDVVPGSTIKRWWQCNENRDHCWEDSPRKLTRRSTKDFCPYCNEGWTLQKLLDVALEFETRGDFRKGASDAYQAARKRGILDQICSHMQPAKTGKKWDEKSLGIEALKYRYRSDFEDGSSGAYDAARRLKILDKICLHMFPKPRGRKRT